MATTLERMQAAWNTGDPLALHREVEQLAAEGTTKERLEASLESLLLEARASRVSDETEEIINSVWDRLTGWCHSSRHIKPMPSVPTEIAVQHPRATHESISNSTPIS